MEKFHPLGFTAGTQWGWWKEKKRDGGGAKSLLNTFFLNVHSFFLRRFNCISLLLLLLFLESKSSFKWMKGILSLEILIASGIPRALKVRCPELLSLFIFVSLFLLHVKSSSIPSASFFYFSWIDSQGSMRWLMSPFLSSCSHFFFFIVGVGCGSRFGRDEY